MMKRKIAIVMVKKDNIYLVLIIFQALCLTHCLHLLILCKLYVQLTLIDKENVKTSISYFFFTF